MSWRSRQGSLGSKGKSHPVRPRTEPSEGPLKTENETNRRLAGCLVNLNNNVGDGNNRASGIRFRGVPRTCLAFSQLRAQLPQPAEGLLHVAAVGLLRAFAYSAVAAFQMKRIAWTWVFGILAVLFNPLARFHLKHGTWLIIYWASIAIILIAASISWRDRGTAAKAENKAP